MDLGIDDDDLATCVACGMCLPHCPTYRVTGEESASPRGRIAAMIAVQRDGAPADEAFAGFMTACVQCRGCETACPSAVPFGRLMTATREALADPLPADSGHGIRPPRSSSRTRMGQPPVWLRAGLSVLGRPRLLRALSAAGAVGQRLHLVPAGRLGLPARLPLRRPRLDEATERDAAPAGEVWLFTGCVMDAWQRPIHLAAARVLGAAGAHVRFPGPAAACCGALHEHAGLGTAARRLAVRTMNAFPGDAPVLVDSAGCGAMLRSYGDLLDTPEARQFSGRVLDVHRWLADHLDRLPAGHRLAAPVAVQDPCHLRHVQRDHAAVATVLGRYAEVVELDDEGLCCGAGGAYSLQEPELAGRIRDRKVASIRRAGAPVVASANPGCELHLAPPLAAAGIEVRHPVELVAAALGLGPR